MGELEAERRQRYRAPEWWRKLFGGRGEDISNQCERQCRTNGYPFTGILSFLLLRMIIERRPLPEQRIYPGRGFVFQIGTHFRQFSCTKYNNFIGKVLTCEFGRPLYCQRSGSILSSMMDAIRAAMESNFAAPQLADVELDQMIVEARRATKA